MVKRYAELIGNYKNQGIKSPQGNKLVCDIDYTGEYIVALHNDTNIPQTVEPNERIAQLVFIPYITDTWQEVDELENTARGEGGFGSTGSH